MDRNRDRDCAGKVGKRVLVARYDGHVYYIRFDNTPDGWNAAAAQMLAHAFAPGSKLPLEIAQEAIDVHWMMFYQLHGTLAQ